MRGSRTGRGRLISWATAFQLRQHIRQSLWVVPLIGTVAGLALAKVDLSLEGRIPLPADWSYTPATAGSMLAAIVGAMVGLVGLVVTIGVLVVQMATGTLSPRFMRLWYRDRLQKLVLASFTATFTFSYSILREVRADSVPDLGVTLAGVAVTLDLVLLLLYLDRFVHTLRPVAVASAMATAGINVIEEMEQEVLEPSAPADPYRAGGQPSLHVPAHRAGAIQAIDVAGLTRFAESRGLALVLRHTVGDFVRAGGTLMDVYGPAGAHDSVRIQGMVALGHERTIDQDPAFALRIMVDIAIRALSPAVNDPTTATQMINHVGSFLLTLGARHTVGNGVRLGPGGEVRLVVPTRTWEDYLDLGVTEIRRYGRTSTQTCRRLRALLLDLEAVVLPANRAAVRRQLEILDRSVQKSFIDPDERALAMAADGQGIGGSRPAG